MTIYRRRISPRLSTGGATDTFDSAPRMVERLRGKEQRRQERELADWEDDGGSATPTDVAADLIVALERDDAVPALSSNGT